MKKKIIALLMALCLTLGVAAPAAAYTPEEEYGLVVELLDYIREYGYELPAQDRETLLLMALEAMFARTDGAYEAFMDAFLSVFDSHTMYVPAGTYDDTFASGGTTAYVGVGITMQLHDKGVLVTEVAAGGPAEAAGIRAGDLIVAADGVSLAGLDLAAVQAKILGEADTAVVLTLERLLRRADVTVTRGKVYQRTFDSRVLEEGVFYMDYNNFSDSSDYIDFIFAIQDLVRSRSKVLILDLRGNPGGVLTYGLSLLNRLIPDKDVAFFGIETRQNGELVTEWYTSDGMGPRLNKIIILQDGGSASASEVVSSSLHDLGYAVTVGQDTVGKARMQVHMMLEEGAAAVVTTGRLVPPHQLDFEGMGLYPDWLIANEAAPHPAADCKPLTMTRIPMNDFSANGKRLNEALIALGYLDAAVLPKGTGWVDEHTMAALRDFQDDYGLMHRATPDVHSMEKLNQVLEAAKLAPSTVYDRQMETALRLARTYLDQPLQYTVDELGNFKNLQ